MTLTTNRDEDSKMKLGKSEFKPLDIEELNKLTRPVEQSKPLDGNQIPVIANVNTDLKVEFEQPSPDDQEEYLDQQIRIKNKQNEIKELDRTGKPMGLIDFITTHKKTSAGVGIGSILLLVIKYFVGC
jgi:hypothetical protein